MANNLSWNPVSVNFNDTSSFMRNAGDSISKAGTVFGELRKAILDEEQRAVENAYKEKVFNENMRQFNERLGFDKGKWEDEKIFKQDESKLNWSRLDEEKRFHNLTADYQNRSLGIQQQLRDLEKAKWDYGLDVTRRTIAAQKEASDALATDRANLQAFTQLRNETLGPTAAQLVESEQELEKLNKKLYDPNTSIADTATISDQIRYHRNRMTQAKNEINDFDSMYNYTPSTPVNGTLQQVKDFYDATYVKYGIPMGAPTPVDSALKTDAEIKKYIFEQKAMQDREDRKQANKSRYDILLENLKNRNKNEGSLVDTKNWGERDKQNLSAAEFILNNDVIKQLGITKKFTAGEIKSAYNAIFGPSSLPGFDTQTSGFFGASHTIDPRTFDLRAMLDPLNTSPDAMFFKMLIRSRMENKD